MSWWKRMLGRQAAAPQPVAEAAPPRGPTGTVIDDDDWQYRRLTQSTRDLVPMTQRRSIELAYYCWERNRLANRLIELPLAYLLAGGVSLQCEDQEAQNWLDEFWRDPISRWDMRLVDRVRELHLFGEQALRIFTNETSGHMRVSGIDPSLIADVITDPDNAEQPIGIKVSSPGGEERTYRVIINADETVLGEAAQKLRRDMVHGDVVFWRINGLTAGARGRSDLLSAVDWCDVYEELLFGEADRATLLRTVLWDCEITGASEDDLKQRAKSAPPPKGNSTRYHNENEKWSVSSPNLSAADFSGTTRTLLTNILGGSTLPGHWYGDGGDVNRATASEMGDPAVKVLSLRQETLKALLEDLAVTVIRSRLKATGRVVPDMLPPELQPRAVMPELTAKDVSRYAQAFQQLVASVIAALSQHLLTEETALSLLALVASQLGLEIDVKTELDNARKEADQAASSDLFPGIGTSADSAPLYAPDAQNPTSGADSAQNAPNPR